MPLYARVSPHLKAQSPSGHRPSSIINDGSSRTHRLKWKSLHELRTLNRRPSLRRCRKPAIVSTSFGRIFNSRHSARTCSTVTDSHRSGLFIMSALSLSSSYYSVRTSIRRTCGRCVQGCLQCRSATAHSANPNRQARTGAGIGENILGAVGIGLARLGSRSPNVEHALILAHERCSYVPGSSRPSDRCDCVVDGRRERLGSYG